MLATLVVGSSLLGVSVAVGASPASPSALGCRNDLECKGDRVCSAGRCIDDVRPDPQHATQPPRPGTSPKSTLPPPHQEAFFGRSGRVLILAELGYESWGGADVRFRGGHKAITADETQLRLGLDVGYFVAKGFSVGGLARLERTTRLLEEEFGSSEASTIVATVGLRPAYYHVTEAGFLLWGAGLLGYTGGRTSESVDEVNLEGDLSGFAAGVSAGIGYVFGTHEGGLLRLGVELVHREISFELNVPVQEAGSTRGEYGDTTFGVTAGAGVFF